MEKPFEESWFYAPLVSVGDRVELSKEESHHLRKVLRLPIGTDVIASNGKGRVFRCETRAQGEFVEVVAAELQRQEPAPPRLNLVLSMLKGRDLEEPIEGVCQVAINTINLVTTQHTQEFKAQDHGRLLERLRTKSLVALKQAKKAWLTEIHGPRPLKEWRILHPETPIVMVHPGEDRLPEIPRSGFAVLTGPEGGFSRPELDWLAREGCFSLGLGTTRIRGAHAPILACGKLMGLNWF